MGYFTMAFVGAAPFGSLLAGVLAHRIGAPHTVMLTGACCIAGAIWFTGELPMVRVALQSAHQQMGVLPCEPSDYPILGGEESQNELA